MLGGNGTTALVKGGIKISRKRHHGWQIFPNTDTLGYYDGMTQTITLNKIRKIDLHNFRNSEDVYFKRGICKIISHEIRHLVDHLSTLWGQHNLVTIYNSMNARLNNDERDFWRIKLAWDELNRNKYFKYYSTVTEDDLILSSREPWDWQLSTGARFDIHGRIKEEMPIMFTRFRAKNNDFVSRVPFSIESLLETNAIHSEFESDIEHINNLPDGEKQVELACINGEYMNWLYNPNLSIYSIAGHLAANTNGITDIWRAFYLSNQIATLSLNMPEKLFKNIRIPGVFNHWGKRNEYFIKQKDRGYLFVCLLHNMKENKNIQCIDDILSCSNLPKAREIESELVTEFEILKEKITKGKLTERLLYLLDLGQKLNKTRGIDGSGEKVLDLIYKNWDILPIIAADDLLENNKELSKWIDQVDALNKQMKEFIDICGI